MTIYTLSIITCTGYPWFHKEIVKVPKSIELHLRFFDLTNIERGDEGFDQSFELFAGLISALFEFARLLNQNIELLKFKTDKNKDNLGPNQVRLISNPLYPIEIPQGTDVLINCQTERFVDPNALEAKINIIFDKVIRNKIPLGPDKGLTRQEEHYCITILEDLKAKEKLIPLMDNIEEESLSIIDAYSQYGLKAFAITSFDFNPLISYGIKLPEIYELFRDIGKFPDVQTYQWKYRNGKIKNSPCWVYIINSGIGVSVENVFMPYYYILICTPESFLGEIPQIIYERLNAIIDHS
jgi:hypothetical protein